MRQSNHQIIEIIEEIEPAILNTQGNEVQQEMKFNSEDIVEEAPISMKIVQVLRELMT